MSDYRFRCTDCGKINECHSTGTVPEIGEEVECINCGRISTVDFQNVILSTMKTDKKVSPSQLEKLNDVNQKEAEVKDGK